MRQKILLFLFLLATPALWAQNPQTQVQPTYRTDATSTNGVAPGYRPTSGAGLTLNIGPGNATCGTVVNYAGGTLTMTDNTTNYIYLNSDTSCAPTKKTTAFTANDVQIATVVTLSGAITSIVDDRTSAINQEPGVLPRSVTITSDALVASDIAGQVVYKSASATAVTLADLTPGWYSSFIVNGAGTVTVSLTGSDTFIGGTSSSTLVVGQNVGCAITLDAAAHYYPHCSSVATIKVRQFGTTFGDTDGPTLSSGSVVYFTVAYACTISAWNMTLDAGTATIDVWKIATGTAIPTVSNTITASTIPAISTGTAKHSTTLTAWTTSVSPNDIFGFKLNAVATAKFVQVDLECNQ